MKFGNIIKSGFGFVKRHDSAILTGVTIVGTLSAVYFAIRDTPKCERLLDELNEEGATKTEKAKALLPLALPTAMATAVAVGSAILNHKVTSDRISSLISAYQIKQAISEEYKKKVQEKLGDEADEIEDDIARDGLKAARNSNASVIQTGHGNDRMYDAWSGREFDSDINHIKSVVNDLNYQLMSEMFISVNEYYQAIGLPGCDAGKEHGWNVDYGMIELRFTAELDENDKPYTMIQFRNQPSLAYERKDRW